MTIPSNGVHQSSGEGQAAAPTLSPTRPMHWTLRRELWENRSVYLAPVAVVWFVLFATILNALFGASRLLRNINGATPARQRDLLNGPFSAIAGTLIFTAFFIAVFYCLDALHSERRDRSILFWKSLPVSDRTIVLAKAAIPLVVLPSLVVLLALPAQFVLLMVTSVRLVGNESALALLWTHVKPVQTAVAVIYGVAALTLWHAPVYGWLLLISGWARRAAILWAVLPALVLAAVERMLFGTASLMRFIGWRLFGGIKQAFIFPPKGSAVVMDPLDHLTPGRFLGSAGLWLGLLFAAVCIAAAIRMRRHAEPVS
ncbi:MAG TPA: ABC transporter permease [Thermoanaerobaculia bacterium]|nr:ABC transporter permease [Thermoanaerobaculia bacterium]